MTRTRPLRGKNVPIINQLQKQPHNGISKATVLSWIKQVLTKGRGGATVWAPEYQIGGCEPQCKMPPCVLL